MRTPTVKAASRRIYGATALLIVGVALVRDDHFWWQVIGFLLLCFVPALVFDGVIHQVRADVSARADLGPGPGAGSHRR